MNPSIHYVGAGRVAPTGDHSQCEALWANIMAEHQAVYGDGSAYNFAACNAHGIRMLGRGWDRSSAANGQQAGVDYNPGSRAMIALVGTDDDVTPQLARAIADFANEAFARGFDRPLRGHSDFVATGCPGDSVRAAIARFNSGIAAEGGPEMTVDEWTKLAGWLQDQRAVTVQQVLDVLIGSHDVDALHANYPGGVLTKYATDTRAAFVAALAKLPPVQSGDPKLLADAVVAGLGAQTAKLVADEIAQRLRA